MTLVADGPREITVPTGREEAWRFTPLGRLRGLHNGEYRLLYVAPERLLLSGFLEDLQKWNVNLFAIDEAHCISEWGHDFRPSYRSIKDMIESIGERIPMIALTATATPKVQSDILKNLGMNEPNIFISSFNREIKTIVVVRILVPHD